MGISNVNEMSSCLYHVGIISAATGTDSMFAYLLLGDLTQPNINKVTEIVQTRFAIAFCWQGA